MLAARVRAQVRARPDDVALVWRGEEVGYGELGRRADELAGGLSGLGFAPGVPVAVRADKSPTTVALLLALLDTGRPFLLLAPDLPATTTATLVARAGCGALLSPAPEAVTPGGTAAPLPAGTAMLLTTSGSTGLPKIVPLPGDGIGRFTRWAADRFGLGPGRTVLNYAPLNFDLCLLDVWATLAAGGRVVLVDPDRATRPAYLAGLLRDHGVHVVQAVPMVYQLLTAQPATFPAVEHVISTGDVLPEWCLSELPRLFPSARRYNLYGCTETNDSFLHELDERTPTPVPLGTPIDGVRSVLVADGAVLTGPGVGELYVSTPFQAPGYLDAAATAAAFGPCPDGTGQHRYFRSGDLVRRHPDGTLTLEGRTDFQVKVRGVRVNPLTVEQVLLAHPAVTAAVVVALPDPVAGHELHAVVSHDGSLNTLVVRGHCAGLLPRAAIPSVIHLADTPLPRTSTGKPDRARITSTYLERTR
ncbi:AMP-binding protein [Actinophytocola sp. KF-1]